MRVFENSGATFRFEKFNKDSKQYSKVLTIIKNAKERS